MWCTGLRWCRISSSWPQEAAQQSGLYDSWAPPRKIVPAVENTWQYIRTFRRKTYSPVLRRYGIIRPGEKNV